MKRIVRKILSQKKYRAIAITAILAMIGAASYTYISIERNVQKMALSDNETQRYFPPYPQINTAGKDAALIKRGEYLAKAGDCMACHTNTPKKGKAFAGGLAMVTPFGTIYSPNITPDKKTGIGNWTDEQFIKAMREGISPSGHYYFPAFPYYYFSKVSTDDLKAIKAYLENIPAVEQENIEADMVKPFNFRFLQLGWRLLFFRSENANLFQPNPKLSAELNRGAYLVDGLGHCAMCHSPSYHLISKSLPLGAPIKKYDLTGAKVQGFLAPDITKANLSTISDDEIVRVFTHDHMIGGGTIEGPMLEVNHDSLNQLSSSDLLAIAKYLKTVESKAQPVASGGDAGKATYETYCSGCHTTGAGGAPKYGDAAAWDAVTKKGMPQVYNNALHGIGGMPAKGTCNACSDDNIKQAVDYMVNSTKGSTGKSIVAATKTKPLTMADGKRIYDANCSVCHVAGFKGAPKPGDMAAWQKIIAAGFYDTYKNVVTGRTGHIPQGACPTCTDGELKAAIKYMMQQSTTTKDYTLW